MAQKVCDCGQLAEQNGYCKKCNDLLDLFLEKEINHEILTLNEQEEEWASRPLSSLEEGELPI